jgi:hypothetical protein
MRSQANLRQHRTAKPDLFTLGRGFETGAPWGDIEFGREFNARRPFFTTHRRIHPLIQVRMAPTAIRRCMRRRTNPVIATIRFVTITVGSATYLSNRFTYYSACGFST